MVGDAHVVEVTKSVDVEDVDIHRREKHVWDKACEHVPRVKAQYTRK